MTRLLQVSNRLPVTVSWCDGKLAVKRAPGGVASGLSAVHRPEHDRWIGWTGHVAEGFDASIAARLDEFGCDPVFLDADEVLGFYDELSNGALWPMLHSRLADLPFELRGWEMYEHVNRKYADAVVAAYTPGDLVWVHDYQLALVPALVRERLPGARIGFFLHVPFPPPEVFRAFPWGPQMIDGLLGADVVGFQTKEYAANFRETATSTPAAPGTDPHTRTWRLATAEVIVDPIGIDPRAWHDLASSPEVEARAAQIRAEAGGRSILVGVDRLDYTKGIPERLAAVRRAYGRGIHFSYAGVAAPTRSGVPAYENLAHDVEAAADAASAAARANGCLFTHVHRSIPWVEVVGLQRDADVIFTSSLADGMNLVPLQAAIAQSLRPAAERAVIVTGKGAGVASAFAGFEQDGLVTVDPLDPAAMDATLRAAVTGELPRVSDRLIAAVRSRDARAWATRFLNDLEEARC